MTRNDIHRPSQIVTADYEFVAIWYMDIKGIGQADFLTAQRNIWKAHMERTGGKHSSHEHGGSCDICGASAIYMLLFYHEKSNTYIRTGSDCADKIEMGYSASGLDAFKKSVHNALEHKAGKMKAKAILDEKGLPKAWEIFDTENKDGFRYEEITITDIVGKLVKYGNVSEKSMDYIVTLLGKIENRPALDAAREIERAAMADCPNGRLQIKGTVVGTKIVEDRFSRRGGEKTMLIIQDETGFKVYGSCFAGLDKGAIVTFTATVEQSDKDCKFGFYKRPVFVLTNKEKAAVKLLKSVASHIWEGHCYILDDAKMTGHHEIREKLTQLTGKYY